MDNKIQGYLRTRNGFTLIELILVIALIMLIGGSIFASQARFITDTYLDTNSEEVIQMIRMAQSRSISRFKDSQWGVRIDMDGAGNNDHFTLFKGSNFVTRDVGYDLRTDLPDSLSFVNVNFGGGSDIVFERVTGKISNAGSFQLSTNQGIAKTITLNSFGQIEIN